MFINFIVKRQKVNVEINIQQRWQRGCNYLNICLQVSKWSCAYVYLNISLLLSCLPTWMPHICCFSFPSTTIIIIRFALISKKILKTFLKNTFYTIICYSKRSDFLWHDRQSMWKTKQMKKKSWKIIKEEIDT